MVSNKTSGQQMIRLNRIKLKKKPLEKMTRLRVCNEDDPLNVNLAEQENQSFVLMKSFFNSNYPKICKAVVHFDVNVK